MLYRDFQEANLTNKTTYNTMCLHFYMYKYNMDMNTRMKYSWNTVMSPDGDTRHVDDCYREQIEAAKGNSLS